MSNGTGAVEAVSFTAPIAGVYQMEVFGYTAATFRLLVDIGTVSGALSGAEVATVTAMSTDREPKGRPSVSPSSQPGRLLVLPAPVVMAQERLFLPSVLR